MKPALPLSIPALLIAALGSVAWAQAIVSTGESFVNPALLVGERQGNVRRAGLLLDVRPGWKTYWRNPGQSGVPPEFDWSGSRNLEAVEIGWPRPEIFDSFGFRTLGYSGEVVLPLALVPSDPGQPIELALDLTLGVCRDICVFEETTIGGRIAPATPATDEARIAAARALIPPAGVDAGVTSAVCTISGTGEDRNFEAVVEFDRPLENPEIALEGPGESWFQKTRADHRENRIEIASTLSLPSDSAWIDRSELRITVLDPAFSADIHGCTAG